MKTKILIMGVILLSFACCEHGKNPFGPTFPPEDVNPIIIPSSRKAEFTLTTRPEPISFVYHPFADPAAPAEYSHSIANFTIVITETNNVGGNIHEFKVSTGVKPDAGVVQLASPCSTSQKYFSKSFAAYGTVELYCSFRAKCKPNYLSIRIMGRDDNDNFFNLGFYPTIVYPEDDD